MKAFERQDIFDLHSWEKAQNYVGEDGYFGNDITQLKRAIRYGHIGILSNFYKKKSWANVFITKGGRNYGLFLPRCNVYEVTDSRIKKASEEFV